VVIAAVPVPEQLGVTTDHRPDGVVEVCVSKPSQNAVAAVQGLPLGWLDGDVDGAVDGELDAELVGGLGVPSPLHNTPFKAKFTGALFVPE
jgi:hypothetical protein